MSTTPAPRVGTRLRCESCGIEVIVIRAPGAPIACCSIPLTDASAAQAKEA